MALTLVNAGATENQSSATYTFLLTWAQSAGDVIVVGVWTSGLTQVINSVTDSAGNIYSFLTTKNANASAGGQNALFICLNAVAASSSSNTVTVKFAASQATATVAVASFTGFGSNGACVDGGVVLKIGTSTSPTASVSVTGTNDLQVAFITTGTGGVSSVGTGTSAIITATNKKCIAYNTSSTTGSKTIAATVGATNDRWVEAILSLQPNTSAPSIPLAQSIYSSTQTDYSTSRGTSTSCILYCDPPVAGNALVLCVSCDYSVGQSIAVSDNAGNTWNAIDNTSNTGNAVYSAAFVAYNVSASTNKITVAFTNGVYGQQYTLVDMWNVATSNALDGHHSTNAAGGTATAIQPGSFTTGTSGDYIFTYGVDTNTWGGSSPNPPQMQTFSPGYGSQLIGGDFVAGTFVQVGIQAAAGAINPYCNINGGVNTSDSWNCIGFALKTATAGGDPFAGGVIGIRRWQNYAYYTGNGTLHVDFPRSGNLSFAATDYLASQYTLSSVNDNYGNTYTSETVSGFPQFFYSGSALSGINSQSTLVVTGGSGPWNFRLYDIVNAATSPYDSTAGLASATIINTNNSNFTAMPVITPSIAPGVTIVVMQNGAGPTTGLVSSPSGAIFDSIWYNNQTDFDTLQQSDGFAHYYYISTAQQSFGWTMNTVAGSLPEGSNALAICFEQAASSTLRPMASGTISVSAAVTVRYPVFPKPSGTVLVTGFANPEPSPLRPLATGTVVVTALVHARVPVFPEASGQAHVVATMTARMALRAPIATPAISVSALVTPRFIFRAPFNANISTSGVVTVKFTNAILPTAIGSIAVSGVAHGNLRVASVIYVTGTNAARNALRFPINAPIVSSGVVTARSVGTVRLQITGLITSSGVVTPHLVGQTLRITASGTVTITNTTLNVAYSAGVYLPTAIGSISTSGTTLVTRYVMFPTASGALELFGQANATNALRLSPLLTGSIYTSSTTLNAGRYLYPGSQGLSRVTGVVNARQVGTARFLVNGSIGLSGVLVIGFQPTRLQINAKAIAILSSYLNVNLIPSHVNPVLITVDVPGYYVVEDAAGCFVVLYLVPGIIYNWIVQVIREGPYSDYQTALAQLMLLASNSYA